MKTPAIILIAFGLAILLIAFRIDRENRKAKAAELPPWTILCNHEGLYTYSTQHGVIHKVSWDSREVAERELAASKKWSDEYDRKLAAGDDRKEAEARLQKERDEQAALRAQFHPCVETAETKHHDGTGTPPMGTEEYVAQVKKLKADYDSAIKLGEKSSDVKTLTLPSWTDGPVEINGVKFYKKGTEPLKDETGTGTLTITPEKKLKVGDIIPSWGSGQTVATKLGTGEVTSVVPDTITLARTDAPETFKDLTETAGSGVNTSPGTRMEFGVASMSLNFCGITVMPNGEVTGVKNLSEDSKAFWKAVTDAYPEFKRAIIEGGSGK